MTAGGVGGGDAAGRAWRRGAGLLLSRGWSGSRRCGGEDGGQPAVDGGHDVGLAEVDVAGVADVAGEGVFLRVAAPVVGDAVVVLALHPAVAEPAVQPAAQGVGVADPLVGLVAGLPCAAEQANDGLGGLEVPGGDEGLLGDGVGPDPLLGVVPAEPGLVARATSLTSRRISSLRCLFQTCRPV